TTLFPYTTLFRSWIRFKANHTWLWKRQLVKHTYDAVRRAPGDDLRRVGGVSSPERGQAGDTAYAVRLDRNLLLVTVDVFRPTSSGVSVSLDPDQRDWLAKVLRRAKKQRVPWVVVQGHVPVLGPVRTRFSSGLTYEGSDLWQLMRKHDVDAYLCGEVHDHTVIRRKGVVQMCHGGLFYRGESSYVLGQVTDTKLMLETRYLQGDPQWSGTKLWSTEGGNGPRRVVYRRPSRVVGTYVLKRDPERPARSNRVKQARGISGAKHQP
ncbi:metallophosphoesterase, partial [Nocardioides sp.]|uniref:metallophosphoesterase family protein n=1 Tax=Nocardioides sp. TaxID=35761 RepID=UPI00355A2477